MSEFLALMIVASVGTPAKYTPNGCSICGKRVYAWYGKRCAKCYLKYQDDDGDDWMWATPEPVDPRVPVLV